MKCRLSLRSVVVALVALAGFFPLAGIGWASEAVVFAAASLKNALDEVAVRFARESGNMVTINYAGTSTLARQIEQGAPADIFFSADPDWMDYLDGRGLIDQSSRSTLLGNSLVLIAPRGSAASATIAPGMDLAGLLGADGRLAIADVDAVPAGLYGKASLVHLGVWQSVTDQIVETDNVRSALAFVARGEAPLGVVYTTDALVEPRVEVIGTFPKDSHPPIRYPVALTADTTNVVAAEFLEFLQTDTARTVFEEQGFEVISKS